MSCTYICFTFVLRKTCVYEKIGLGLSGIPSVSYGG